MTWVSQQLEEGYTSLVITYTNHSERTLCESFAIYLCSTLFYGKMANERTGKPDAFSALGTILKITAPLAGT